jgi:serine/threonine-protein kinase HipA
MNKHLNVYLNDMLIGYLLTDAGSMSFRYTPEYATKEDAPALSVALPVQQELYLDTSTRPFFSGLLPDEGLKKRVARLLHVSDKNPFAMLAQIGRECAGAISFYPPDESPSDGTQHIKLLDDAAVVEMLAILKKRPLLVGSDDVRLSLAGAQDKVAILMDKGRVGLAQGGQPTSHILKPAMIDFEDSVYNEFFCMRLAARVGIDTARVELKTARDRTFLLVSRYDRTISLDGKVLRLHQEDFCQAASILPEMKYENEGGPSIALCMDLIGRYSAQPAVDQRNFLRRIIFNYLIGNADAHGKNFSFLHQVKKVRLAPAYDLLSTSIYDGITDKMAMKIGGRYQPQQLCLRHWQRLVVDTQTAQRHLQAMMNTMAEKTVLESKNLSEQLSCKHPELRNTAERIVQLIEQRAGVLSAF